MTTENRFFNTSSPIVQQKEKQDNLNGLFQTKMRNLEDVIKSQAKALDSLAVYAQSIENDLQRAKAFVKLSYFLIAVGYGLVGLQMVLNRL